MLNYLSTNLWCLVVVELSIVVSWCDDWQQLVNTQLFCKNNQIPEYLIIFSGTPLVNWSETLPFRREWVAKITGFSSRFNPLTTLINTWPWSVLTLNTFSYRDSKRLVWQKLSKKIWVALYLSWIKQVFYSLFIIFLFWIYYESIKREPKIRGIL